MPDRTLPNLLRLALVGMGLMQLSFGATVLLNPEAINSLWPWPLTTISTRLLGASTLVSVPLAFGSAWFNRWSAARISLVMMLTYRVLQIAAGLVHYERFDLAQPTTWNYFGGGGLMLAVLAFALARGHTLGQPADDGQAWLRGQAALVMGTAGRVAFRAIAVLFVVLGVLFFVLGENAAWLWFEAPGALTGLTARLFSSPMVGLALAAWLISNAKYWREVGLPAAGMATFGVAGFITLLIESAGIQPPTPLGYLIAATPLILLAMGFYLLWPGRSRA